MGFYILNGNIPPLLGVLDSGLKFWGDVWIEQLGAFTD